MRKFLILIIFISLGVGCNNKELPKGTDQVMHVDSSRSVSRQPIYSNPNIIEGSSFLNYFMALLRVQDYNSLLKLTAPSSIRQYGGAKILNRYKNIKTNFELKLISSINTNDTTTMRYSVTIFGTKKFRDIKVIVFKDTCRVVLPTTDLGEFLK